MKIYKGNVVYTKTPEAFELLPSGYIVVEDGKVKYVGSELPEAFDSDLVEDFGENLIIPGFVDLHFHAPQYANLGLGLDKELLPWLTEYTFPEEAKYADLAYARKVFSKVAHDLWRNGTTRVVLLSTLHREATELLMSMFNEYGLGAYIGKVNMDRNSPEFLIESTQGSLEETRIWLENTHNRYERVKPIMTPRFVPTCSSELMSGLGELAAEYNVPIQSHISENLSEIDWVKELHPNFENYASVYAGHRLMTPKTVMAHCVHNTEAEIQIFKENGVYAAHCPNANYNLSSGIMPVRKFMNEGVLVGLGTDVGAGHKVSIASVMTSAIQASKMVWLHSEKQLNPLSLSEAFYLGTKGGGSFFGKVGSFEEGYEFDALIIEDSNLKITEGRSLEERLQRFIYTGDDRHITHRFISGELILDPLKHDLI